MKYVTLDHCKRFVFPYIYEQLSDQEPSAQYDREPSGLSELDKVLHLVQNDSFYPHFQDKAAYLLCSIAGSQYFSNGNKRLGVIVLVLFLILNDARVLILTPEQYRELLQRYFPAHAWEDNASLRGGDPLFLYNLAIVIGDRKRWGSDVRFSGLKSRVADIFETLYRFQAGS